MACTPKPFCPVFSVVRSSGLHSCTCTLCICVAKPFLILEFSKEKLECGNVLWHCFFILPIPIELRGSLQSLRPLFMERAHCLVSRASALARQQSLTHLTKKKVVQLPHTKKKKKREEGKAFHCHHGSTHSLLCVKSAVSPLNLLRFLCGQLTLHLSTQMSCAVL